MYIINKIVGSLVSPVGMGLALVAIGVAMMILKKTCARRFFFGAALWMWAWATPLMSLIVGSSLECEFLVGRKMPRIESLPQADAILLLGGGMGGDTNICEYAEMWGSADRVWQAARLYKAGKAPKIYASGGHVEMTTWGLLQDLGVSREAIVFVEEPRNTEEEAKHYEEVIAHHRQPQPATSTSAKPKVLLVTSAWHMKRAKLMFEKYAPGVEAISAPADWEATYKCAWMDWWSALLPRSENLMWNEVWFHEWLGIIGYKLLR